VRAQIKKIGYKMLSFIKRLFGTAKTTEAGELAPYKVDAPVAPVVESSVIIGGDSIVTSVEGAGVVEAPAKKPRAKKPAAPKAPAKKPRAKKAK
jgi:hypothetical protein